MTHDEDLLHLMQDDGSESTVDQRQSETATVLIVAANQAMLNYPDKIQNGVKDGFTHALAHVKGSTRHDGITKGMVSVPREVHKEMVKNFQVLFEVHQGMDHFSTRVGNKKFSRETINSLSVPRDKRPARDVPKSHMDFPQMLSHAAKERLKLVAPAPAKGTTTGGFEPTEEERKKAEADVKHVAATG